MRAAWIAFVMVVGCEQTEKKPAPAPRPPPSIDATAATEVKPLEPPQVARHGYAAFDERHTLVIATKNGIVVDGKSIVSIVRGRIDPQDLEGGVLGARIPRLADFVATLVKERAKHPEPVPAFGLLIDRTLPYDLLFKIVFSIKASAPQLEVVAQSGPDHVAVPIAMAAPVAASGVAEGSGVAGEAVVSRAGSGRVGRGTPPVRIVVSIAKDRLVVWSLSGVEGTLDRPAVTIDPASPSAGAELGQALAKLVARQWPGGKRTAAERVIILQADDAIPMQWIADALGAVRATSDGEELFPEVVLSSGFQ